MNDVNRPPLYCLFTARHTLVGPQGLLAIRYAARVLTILLDPKTCGPNRIFIVVLFSSMYSQIISHLSTNSISLLWFFFLELSWVSCWDLFCKGNKKWRGLISQGYMNRTKGALTRLGNLIRKRRSAIANAYTTIGSLNGSQWKSLL